MAEKPDQFNFSKLPFTKPKTIYPEFLTEDEQMALALEMSRSSFNSEETKEISLKKKTFDPSDDVEMQDPDLEFALRLSLQGTGQENSHSSVSNASSSSSSSSSSANASSSSHTISIRAKIDANMRNLKREGHYYPKLQLTEIDNVFSTLPPKECPFLEEYDEKAIKESAWRGLGWFIIDITDEDLKDLDPSVYPSDYAVLILPFFQYKKLDLISTDFSQVDLAKKEIAWKWERRLVHATESGFIMYACEKSKWSMGISEFHPTLPLLLNNELDEDVLEHYRDEDHDAVLINTLRNSRSSLRQHIENSASLMLDDSDEIIERLSAGNRNGDHLEKEHKEKGDAKYSKEAVPTTQNSNNQNTFKEPTEVQDPDETVVKQQNIIKAILLNDEKELEANILRPSDLDFVCNFKATDNIEANPDVHPLSLAIKNKNIPMIKKLLKLGAKVLSPIFLDLIKAREYYGKNADPLNLARMSNHPEIEKIIYSAALDELKRTLDEKNNALNIEFNSSVSEVYRYAALGDSDKIEAYVTKMTTDNNFDSKKLLMKGPNGYSAAILAAFSGSSSAFLFLLNLNPEQCALKDTALNCLRLVTIAGHLVIFEDTYRFIEKQAKTPQEINAFNQIKGRVLFTAIQCGHLAIIQFLLDKNPDLVFSTLDGNSTLIVGLLAKLDSHFKKLIVLALLNYDTSDNNELILKKDTLGRTVFKIAFDQNDAELMEVFHDNEPRLLTEKFNDILIFYEASELNKKWALEMFVNMGLDPDQLLHQKNKFGQTALTLAAITGSLECFEYLLVLERNCGKENTEKSLLKQTVNYNNSSYTAFQLAIIYGRTSIVQFVVETNIISAELRNLCLNQLTTTGKNFLMLLFTTNPKNDNHLRTLEYILEKFPLMLVLMNGHPPTQAFVDYYQLKSNPARNDVFKILLTTLLNLVQAGLDQDNKMESELALYRNNIQMIDKINDENSGNLGNAIQQIETLNDKVHLLEQELITSNHALWEWKNFLGKEAKGAAESVLAGKKFPVCNKPRNGTIDKTNENQESSKLGVQPMDCSENNDSNQGDSKDSKDSQEVNHPSNIANMTLSIRDCNNMIFAAIVKDNVELLESLLKPRLHLLISSNSSGETPFMAALRYGAKRSLEFLLKVDPLQIVMLPNRGKSLFRPNQYQGISEIDLELTSILAEHLCKLFLHLNKPSAIALREILKIFYGKCKINFSENTVLKSQAALISSLKEQSNFNAQEINQANFAIELFKQSMRDDLKREQEEEIKNQQDTLRKNQKENLLLPEDQRDEDLKSHQEKELKARQEEELKARQEKELKRRQEIINRERQNLSMQHPPASSPRQNTIVFMTDLDFMSGYNKLKRKATGNLNSNIKRQKLKYKRG